MQRFTTPLQVVRRNGVLLLLSMGITFVVLRVSLHLSPDADFNVGGHNIHHLFTGLVLIALGGIPLAIFRGRRAGSTPPCCSSAAASAWRSTNGFT